LPENGETVEFVAPDILADICELSLGPLALGLAVGLFLWLYGWRTHRFWVVLLMTVLAGLYGLYEASAFDAQPLVSGLLLAVAAGVMALALIRLLAFTAGGLAGVLAIQAIAPGWNQPLLVFMASGLFGLLLFRVWIMALTSLAGSLLMTCASLAIARQTLALNVVAWCETSTGLVNGLVVVLSVVGLFGQYLLDRRCRRKKDKSSGKSADKGDRQILVALPLGWDIKFHKKAS
jgi:hypothetical protein